MLRPKNERDKTEVLPVGMIVIFLYSAAPVASR